MVKAKKLLVFFLSVAVMVAFIPSYAFAASLTAPKGVQATVASSTSITLTWGKVKAAKGYKIYCKAPDASKFKVVKTIKKKNTVSWTYTGLEMDKTYEFKLKAFKGKKLSKFSKKVSATPQLGGLDKLAASDIVALSNNVDSAFAYDLTSTLAYDQDYWDADNGWRTAGSDAEHRAADYIADVYEDIGLEEVEKVPVTVDKWQYNGASLKLTNDGGSKKVNVSCTGFGIGSYASSFDGVATGDIVYMGGGYEEDYETYYDAEGLEGADRNMNGKLVLADINQDEAYWIDGYYTEAWAQGAAGLITYSSQYIDENGEQTETKWDEAVQIQDSCSRDFGIPCVTINRAEGLKLKNGIAKIEAAGGKQKVRLEVHNEIAPNAGTTYNVIGKIKGTGNTGQQILVAGHYDKYWYGFQDDCAAIGVIAGIAKALVDSEYKPVNDIIFIAHGAEEWGRTGNDTDWAMGSWGMITKAHPEWAGKTLALFNYELPAKKGKSEDLGVSVNSSEEIATTTDLYNDGDLLALLNDGITKEAVTVRHSSPTMSDGIAYQVNGVPHVQVTTTCGVSDDLFSIYHTNYDDKTTYMKKAMKDNILYSAGYIIKTDKTPALQLDFALRVKQMERSLDEPELYADANATAEAAAFEEAIAQLKDASDAFLAEATAINDEYVAAVEAGDAEAVEAAQAKALEHNQKALNAYKLLQDGRLLGFNNSTDFGMANGILQDTIWCLNDCIEGIENKDFGQVLGSAGSLHGEVGWNAYDFSKAAAVESVLDGSEAYGNDTWTGGRSPAILGTDVTEAIYDVAHTEDLGECLAQKVVFENAKIDLQSRLKERLASDVEAINAMIDAMK